MFNLYIYVYFFPSSIFFASNKFLKSVSSLADFSGDNFSTLEISLAGPRNPRQKYLCVFLTHHQGWQVLNLKSQYFVFFRGYSSKYCMSSQGHRNSLYSCLIRSTKVFHKCPPPPLPHCTFAFLSISYHNQQCNLIAGTDIWLNLSTTFSTLFSSATLKFRNICIIVIQKHFCFEAISKHHFNAYLTISLVRVNVGK